MKIKVKHNLVIFHNTDDWDRIKEKIKQDAKFYKIVNLLVPILLVLLFALIMGYLRKNRYAKNR